MSIQVALVKWGNKYSAEYVNALVEVISARSEGQLEFHCITEDGSGLSDRITVHGFPDFGVPFDDLVRSGGCRAKLAVFSREVSLRPGKTVYLDLDTAVFGDVAGIASVLDVYPVLHALPNHMVPHWRFPWLSWLTPEKCFFVNSSIMAFRRELHFDIFDDFVAAISSLDFPYGNGTGPWHMKSDEAFVSMHEKGRLRALDRRLAGSFKDLYLMPSVGLAKMQDSLSFVRRRRANRVALTFHGNSVKPEIIAEMKEGDLLVAGSLKARWAYKELSEYWRDLLSRGKNLS